MRLIDADALQREYMQFHDGKRSVLVDVAPTIEPEIIRCKDCKAFYDGKWCVRYLKAFNAEDFCSYAERREE